MAFQLLKELLKMPFMLILASTLQELLDSLLNLYFMY
jgi:hypothetical protein